MGPGDLRKILEDLPFERDANIIVGLDGNEDAAVYRAGDGRLLLFTADFFTPVVDDPYLWGQIAAANALSDIYAMGGRPLVALNISMFPCAMADVFKEVLRGGVKKASEAGCTVVGGHSLEDKEPKYGLAVLGEVGEGSLLRNSTAEVGDHLVLTKPLGFGILATAIKRDLIREGEVGEALDIAARLNKDAAEAAVALGASACTDVTGFGLAGHLSEMLSGKLSAHLWAHTLPVHPRAIDLAKVGSIPGGTNRNRDYYGTRVSFAKQDDWLGNIVFDPQTSGGLLIAISPQRAGALLRRLHKLGETATIVGEFVEGDGEIIVI